MRIVGRSPEYIILASSHDRVQAKVFDLLKPKIDIAFIANSVPNGRRPNGFLKLLIKLFGALERIAVGINLDRQHLGVTGVDRDQKLDPRCEFGKRA